MWNTINMCDYKIQSSPFLEALRWKYFTFRAGRKSGMDPEPELSKTSESIRTKDPVAVRTYLSESLKLEARGF